MNEFQDVEKECLPGRDDPVVDSGPCEGFVALKLNAGMRPAFLNRCNRTTPWRHSPVIGARRAR